MPLSLYRIKILPVQICSDKNVHAQMAVFRAAVDYIKNTPNSINYIATIQSSVIDFLNIMPVGNYRISVRAVESTAEIRNRLALTFTTNNTFFERQKNNTFFFTCTCPMVTLRPQLYHVVHICKWTFTQLTESGIRDRIVVSVGQYNA